MSRCPDCGVVVGTACPDPRNCGYMAAEDLVRARAGFPSGLRPKASLLPVAVLCAGGHGQTLKRIMEAAGRTVTLWDDSGVGVAGSLVLAERLCPRETEVVVGLGLVDGRMTARAAMAERFHRLGFKAASVVADSAVIMGDLGAGAQVLPGAVVGVGAAVHGGAIIGAGAVVEHDAVVGDWAFVGPGAILCGGVVLGEGAVIGAGAVVLPGIWVGDGATVGAGAVVTVAVVPGTTVVGVPAKQYRKPITFRRGTGLQPHATPPASYGDSVITLATTGIVVRATAENMIGGFPCDQECPE